VTVVESSAEPTPAGRYAVGLPWVGPRALEARETTQLLRQLRRVRLEIAGALAAMIVVGLGLALSGAPLTRVGGPAAAWLGLVGLAGLLGCLLWARGGWRLLAALGSAYLLVGSALGELQPVLVPRPTGLDAAVVVGMILLGTSFVAHTLVVRVALAWRARTIETDLDGGVVDRFAGPVRSTRPAVGLRRLLGDALLERGAVVRIEVLPRSGLVVKVNGRRQRGWHTAHVAEVAATQPHALRIGLPRELAAAPADTKLKLERRSLSPQERAELQAHARRLGQRWGPVTAVTIAVVGVLAWHAMQARNLADAFDVVSVLWYGLAIVAWIGYVRRLRAAHKLRCDERLRWVVTVRDADAPDASTPKLEVLPVSQLAWTEHARPAGWRTDEL
jgi:hypothetical protein